MTSLRQRTTEVYEVLVCRIDELPPDEVAVVDADVRIAVFNRGGTLLAVEDRCSHQEAYLSDGFVEGTLVECPLHASCFDLSTGQPTGPPATRPVRTFEVRERAGMVFVVVPR